MAADVKHIKAQIDISAAKANVELNKLANKLEKISASISEINSRGLNDFTSSVEKLGQSMQILGKIEITNFTHFADSIQRISSLDLTGITEFSGTLAEMSAVSENVNGLTESFGLLEGGLTALNGVWDIVTRLSGLGKTLADTESGLEELFGSKGVIAKVSGSFSELFIPLPTNIGKFFADILAGTETIGGAFTAVFGISAGAAVGIVAAIAAIVLAIVDLWNTSEQFRDIVGLAFTMVKDTLSDAFQKVGDAVAPLWESIKGLGAALYELYESSGLKGLVEILASLTVILAGIVGSAMIETLSSMLSGMARAAQGVVDVVTGLVEIITGIFTFDGEKILEGCSKIGEGIVEIFIGIGEHLYGAVIEIGKNIISGLWEGISGEQGTLQKGVGDVCLDLVEGFRENLDIHSPSKVLAEIGSYAVLGLAEPFSDSGMIMEQIRVFSETLMNIFREQLSPENFTLIAEAAFLAFMETFQLGFENMQLLSGESMQLLSMSVAEALTLMNQQIGLIFTAIAMLMAQKWTLMLNQTRLIWMQMNLMITQNLTLLNANVTTGMNAVNTGWMARWRGFVSTVRSACSEVQSAVSSLNSSVQGMCSSMMSAIRAVKAAASSMSAVSVRTHSVKGFASGGYPETGELFLAHENGMNEMVGRIGNHSAVANNDQIVEAIRGAVMQGMHADGQTTLLREQNMLLRAILEKDTDISLDGRSLVDGIDRARKRMGLSFQPA